MQINGIHHVTAISGPARRNLDFYGRVLGLRLVKKTVNFDDPGTYHLYYGDKAGNPGSVLTFFPMPGLPQGRIGRGQAVEIVFAIPKSAFSFWLDRFHQKGISYQGPERRFDETILRIADPDGLMLEFVGVDTDTNDEDIWTTDEIGKDVAIRGFHSVALWVDDQEKTAKLLTEDLGFSYLGSESSRHRFTAGGSGIGQVVDLRQLPEIWRGAPGAGTIHHVAFRTDSDENELKLREQLLAKEYRVTGVMDRNYFHSVYFRESNGILFEIATDQPGFAIDEEAGHLGEALKLPAQYEAHRAEIERALPALN